MDHDIEDILNFLIKLSLQPGELLFTTLKTIFVNFELILDSFISGFGTTVSTVYHGIVGLIFKLEGCLFGNLQNIPENVLTGIASTLATLITSLINLLITVLRIVQNLLESIGTFLDQLLACRGAACLFHLLERALSGAVRGLLSSLASLLFALLEFLGALLATPVRIVASLTVVPLEDIISTVVTTLECTHIMSGL